MRVTDLPEAVTFYVFADIDGLRDRADNPVPAFNSNTVFPRSRSESFPLASLSLIADGALVESPSHAQHWTPCALGQGEGCAGSASTYTWYEALGACNELNDVAHEGRTNWHLPRWRELMSLVAWDATVSPRINTTLFPNAAAKSFWTSTGIRGNLTQARTVDFSTGLASAAERASRLPVRCVSGATFVRPSSQRGGYDGPLFVGSSAGPATFDRRQDLVWELNDNAGLVDIAGAVAHCESLDESQFAGLIGWRLPQVRELYTLIDPGSLPAADGLLNFSAGTSFPTWSSMKATGVSRILVDLYDGRTTSQAESEPARVRCVASAL